MTATITYRDVVFGIAATLFILGVVSVISGFVVLLSRAMGKGIRDIAEQAKQMVAKGITEDISGLVGNATALMGALDSMVRTTTGIGAFLILIGSAMITGSWHLFNKIDWL